MISEIESLTALVDAVMECEGRGKGKGKMYTNTRAEEGLTLLQQMGAYGRGGGGY